MIVLEILKFAGVAVTTIVAVVAVYTDGTKSAAVGKLTRKGRVLVGLAVLGLVLAGGVQIAQVSSALDSAESLRRRHEETATRLEAIPMLMARAHYPLEPMEIFLEIEYPMDQSSLKGYTDRLESDITSFLRSSREGRGETSDDLSEEDVLFVVTNNDGWVPTSDEGHAGYLLLGDDTRIHLSRVGDEHPRVMLASMDEGTQSVIVTRPSQQSVEQHIELRADFQSRMFTKIIRCVHPVRLDNNADTLSVLDLLGMTLSAQVGGRPGNLENWDWRLAAIEFRFSYEYGYNQRWRGSEGERRIVFPVGTDTAVLTAAHLGMAEVDSTDPHSDN